MNIKNHIQTQLSGKYSKLRLLFSVSLAFASLLSVSSVAWNWPVFLHPFETELYFATYTLLVLTVGAVLCFPEPQEKKYAQRTFLALLPAAVIFFLGICLSRNFDFSIYFLVGLYWISLGGYFFSKKDFGWKLRQNEKEIGEKSSTFSLAGKPQWLIVIFLVLIYLIAGSFHIDRFAAVDEPLWSFGRIPQYWSALAQKDWAKTLVSDKPGVTISIVSGTGLLWEDPQEYDTIFWEGKSYRSNTHIENMNLALRLPILILTGLLLPLFYILIRKIWNKNAAVLALVFLALSPILIGVSRIINPDALLWSFSGLSILSFLAYVKHREKRYVIMSGIFWGLSLLTKYIANLFFIYFLGILLLDYAFNRDKYQGISAREYIRKSLKDYAVMILFALAVVSVILPMVWIRPQEILDVTIRSEAFLSSWPLFATILSVILLDAFLIGGKGYAIFSQLFQKYKTIIFRIISLLFLASIIFILLDALSGMKALDLEKFFTAPKSLRSNPISIDSLQMLLANFYPLIFGISPLPLLFAAFPLSLILINKSKNRQTNIIYLVIFIFLYYLGSAINGVASITRYQIMVFPVMLIISGLGAYQLLTSFKNRFVLPVAAIAIMLATSFSLYKTYPFYLSYASDLLPKKYTLDLKDMGSGSYEAAEFLNSLPDAENVSIWTDKQGVCYFFKGFCYTGFDSSLKQKQLDYVVVSSGRENRTGKMTKKSGPDFTPYYDKKGSIAFEILINGRPGQFIRVVKN